MNDEFEDDQGTLWDEQDMGSISLSSNDLDKDMMDDEA